MRVVLVPEAVDLDALLADPRRQTSEVAIGGDETEAGKAAGVEQVHGVNNHRTVGGVFAGCVGKLLDGYDGVF